MVLFGRVHSGDMQALLALVVGAGVVRVGVDMWGCTDVVHGLLALCATVVRKVPFLLAQQQLPLIFNLG